MSNKTAWSKETYEWCMSHQGRVSARVTERITGVPAPTILAWWRGTRPRCLQGETWNLPGRPRQTHCMRGHRLQGENAYVRPDGTRLCRRCRRASQAAWGYRKRGRFHPILNPDPMLAPVRELFFRGPILMAEVLKGTTYSEIYASADGATRRVMSAVHNGHRYWMSYTAADRMCAVAGFPVSALNVQPEHIGHPSAKEAA